MFAQALENEVPGSPVILRGKNGRKLNPCPVRPQGCVCVATADPIVSDRVPRSSADDGGKLSPSWSVSFGGRGEGKYYRNVGRNGARRTGEENSERDASLFANTEARSLCVSRAGAIALRQVNDSKSSGRPGTLVVHRNRARGSWRLHANCGSCSRSLP